MEDGSAWHNITLYRNIFPHFYGKFRILLIISQKIIKETKVCIGNVSHQLCDNANKRNLLFLSTTSVHRVNKIKKKNTKIHFKCYSLVEFLQKYSIIQKFVFAKNNFFTLLAKRTAQINIAQFLP